MRMSKPSPLKRSLRVLFALSILGGLCYYTGIGPLWEAISNISLFYVLILAALTVILIWISCVKWQLFVRASGHDATVGRLMKIYTMSYFFNLFMPSTIGGDVARSLQLGSRIGNYRDAFAATFVERFTGFLAMNLVGVVFVIFGARATAGVEWAILSVSFVTCLAALILFSEKLTRRFANFSVQMVRIIGLRKLAAKLEKFVPIAVEGMRFAQQNDRLFVLSMFYSLLFHFFAVINTYAAALSIGWETVSFGKLCLVVPLVLLVAVAPVTPSAIGIQEGAFLYFLTRIGATHAEALGVGLILRAKSIITACIGGLIWVLTREVPRVGGDEIDPLAEPESDRGVPAANGN
jgi:uncharacterized protein (TIRG00374 family)